MLVWLGALVLPLLAVTLAEDPLVTIKQGTLRGKNMTSRKGRKFFAFQGIPYAAPPLGDLRFKPPQEAPSWQGERNAQNLGKECIQIQIVVNALIGDEDCLFVNVYTPQLRGPSLSSVMVWVHGGGFLFDSGGTLVYGPHYLMDHDIVLVTFNYRLTALGFLSLGTPEMPGNYGLKDQVAALRWVKENIVHFGGNPDSVTVFGESAGGASVHYLMLSPLTQGLMHRAIVQSGSAHNPWALTPHAPQVALALADELGCKSDEPSAVMQCLKDVDAGFLTAVSTSIAMHTIRYDDNFRYIFSPTIEPVGTEGAFITEDPRVLLARGEIIDVPLIAGVMTHEGILHLVLKEWHYVHDYLYNFNRFLPRGEPRNSSAAARMRCDIDNFYRALGGGDFLEQYVLLNTDVDFALGVDELVRGVAALNRSPVFYYRFSYDGDLALIKKIKWLKPGTAHADDLGYLFSQDFRSSIPFTAIKPEDQQTIDRVTKLWTNFANFGDPTPRDGLGVTWLPVWAPQGCPELANTRHLDIGSRLTMRDSNLNSERVAFWQELRASCTKPCH